MNKSNRLLKNERILERGAHDHEKQDNSNQRTNWSFQHHLEEEIHSMTQKSFTSISCIPLKSRFSVIVARRVYKKIGDKILKQKNIQNYNNAGKIYVPIYEKILQTFLSIIDFITLLFVKELNYDNDENHNILNKEINLDERI